MSDDGLFEWAVVWSKRVAALALLTGMAAAVVGAGVFAVGTLLDGGQAGDSGGLIGGPDTTTPTTPAEPPDDPETGSGGVDNETTTATRLVVGVETEDVREPDQYTETVAHAVTYWSDHADLAGYDVRPVVNVSAENPDVLVRVTPNVTCEGDAGAVGCAPLVSGPQTLGDTVTVRLEPRPNDRLTYRIAVHELGHVFGAEHCAEPRTFMYMDCPSGARSGERPDATERDSPWAPLPWDDDRGAQVGTELRVYIDTSGPVPGEKGEAETQVERALDYYERKAGEDGVGPVQFTRVDDPYRADVRVNFSEETTLCALPRVCRSTRGVSTDGEEHFERFSYVRIELALDDPDRIGWRTGYQLGEVLGAETDADLPPVFRNSEAVDPTGPWWTYEEDD